ncbi:MAG: hypothetical protein ACI4JM_04345, partial [Oscillospiraceae bacterium]
GAAAPALNGVQKSFLSNFSKKVWAAESRLMKFPVNRNAEDGLKKRYKIRSLMKFPVNRNGRPMVAPTL